MPNACTTSWPRAANGHGYQLRWPRDCSCRCGHQGLTSATATRSSRGAIGTGDRVAADGDRRNRADPRPRWSGAYLPVNPRVPASQSASWLYSRPVQIYWPRSRMISSAPTPFAPTPQRPVETQPDPQSHPLGSTPCRWPGSPTADPPQKTHPCGKRSHTARPWQPATGADRPSRLRRLLQCRLPALARCAVANGA